MKLPEGVEIGVEFKGEQLPVTWIVPMITEVNERASELLLGFASMADAIANLGNALTTGAVCGDRPRGDRATRRKWRACKRAFTQTKWDRLPRGQR